MMNTLQTETMQSKSHLKVGKQPFKGYCHSKPRKLQVKTNHHVQPSHAGKLHAGQVQQLERSLPEEDSKILDQARLRFTEGADEQEQQGGEKFNWLKTWYAVAIEQDTPPDRPTQIRLLGNPIVLWKDGKNKWRAFKDLCPHRLVPLSEGRVENGNLMCSYHGWQFQGEGKLTDIPQADDASRLEAAIDNERSCCSVHPCQVVDGLIWVYGSCEPGAAEEAKTKSIESLRIPKNDDWISIPWFVRDVPYGVDTLLENVLDPSHVPFSHHGVQGNRFKVKKMHMKAAPKLDPATGFTVTAVEPEDLPAEQHSPMFPYDLSYTPPSLIRYSWNNGNILATHAVPTDPGKSRIIFTALFARPRPTGPAGLVFKLLLSKWGLWVDHFTRNSVLDGDGVFLYYQSLKNMETAKEKGGQDISKSYFMPASLDYGVRALRQWLAKHAEPFPWGPGAADPTIHQARSELLNRYEQHTKLCPSCSMAHATFKALRWVAAGAAIATACAAAYSLGSGFTFKKLLLPFIATVISAAIAWKSQTFKQQFEFVDYRHPEH